MQSVVVAHFCKETWFLFPAQLEKLHCLMKESRSPGVMQERGSGGTQKGKETGEGVSQGSPKQAVQRRSKKA